MNTSFLLLGGNLGDRKGNLKKARQLIDACCGKVLRSSSLYETAAWGNTHQFPFLNQAVELSTPLNARELMEKILGIEMMMGRERKEKYGPRLIDIDILLFNNEEYNEPLLKIPHPEMQNRRFALTPLAEIAGDWQHPIFKKSISRLLAECIDELKVKKYKK